MRISSHVLSISSHPLSIASPPTRLSIKGFQADVGHVQAKGGAGCISPRPPLLCGASFAHLLSPSAVPTGMARVSPRRAAQLPETLSSLQGLTQGLPFDEQVYAEEMQRMRQEDTGRGGGGGGQKGPDFPLDEMRPWLGWEQVPGI